ncbi:MAG: hypothetical protein EZS28_030638, partial [Streblomastix strix]
MAEILSRKIAVQASMFMLQGYPDRSFIFRGLCKFRLVESDCKIVIPRRRTMLEQDNLYSDAIFELIDEQQALRIAIENVLDGHNNIEQITYAYAMLYIGAHAVMQLRELANAPREQERVIGGKVSGAKEGGLDIFSISIRAILISTVLGPVIVVAVAVIPTVLTVLAIWDTVNTVCCEPVQLWERSSNRKRIPIERKRTKRAYEKINMDKTIKIGWCTKWKSRESRTILAKQRRVFCFNGNEEQAEQLDQLIKEELNQGFIRVVHQQEIANVEQNICNMETGKRIEENNGLLIAQRPIEIKTFLDERLEQTFNHVAVIGQLDKYLAFTHRWIHYMQVGMPFWISITPRTFAKTIYIIIDDLTVVEQRNGMDYGGVSEIWMGDQREQQQTEPEIAICVLKRNVQLANNENLVVWRQEEGIKGVCLKIKKVDNGSNVAKDQRGCKF